MTSTSEFKEYKKEIMDAAHDEQLRTAMTRAIKSFRGNVNNALKKYPHTIGLAEEVLSIKQNAVPEMESLARQAVAAIEENHGKGYIARTNKEALDIISGLVGKGKLIVKGKSMTGEEIGLREHLEKEGNEVYETDLGEFIIQKLGSRPMHILSPSVHVPRGRGCAPFFQGYGTGYRAGCGDSQHGGRCARFLEGEVF